MVFSLPNDQMVNGWIHCATDIIIYRPDSIPYYQFVHNVLGSVNRLQNLYQNCILPLCFSSCHSAPYPSVTAFSNCWIDTYYKRKSSTTQGAQKAKMQFNSLFTERYTTGIKIAVLHFNCFQVTCNRFWYVFLKRFPI